MTISDDQACATHLDLPSSTLPSTSNGRWRRHKFGPLEIKAQLIIQPHSPGLVGVK